MQADGVAALNTTLRDLLEAAWLNVDHRERIEA
jgi:hypothetical protein